MEDLNKTSKPASLFGYDTPEIDLSMLVSGLWKDRVIITCITGVATVAALLVSLMLPKIYESDATLLPTSSDSGQSLLAGFASQLGSSTLLGNLGSSRGADIVEILNSRTMAARVIAVCQLDKELKGWGHHDELVSMVQDMTTISGPSLKSKVVKITVQAPEAEVAQRIANAYVSELKSMLDEIGYNSASKNRKFVENQRNKVQIDLKKSEESLSAFQSANRLSVLPEAIVSSINSISELEAKQIETRIQISATNEAVSSMRSNIDTLQAQPGALVDLDIKRRELQAQQLAILKEKEQFLSRLSTLPPKAMQLARLQRDVQVQNAIYLALSQQYETAVITENRDSDAFIPLDKAVAPLWAIKPRKSIITFMGFAAGLFLSVMWAVIRTSLSKGEAR